MLSTAEVSDRGRLGNPFTTDEWTRRAAIGAFRPAFEPKLEGDAEFRRAVRQLAGETLGRWCQSLHDDGPACHAEVIAERAERSAPDRPGNQATLDGRPADA